MGALSYDNRKNRAPVLRIDILVGARGDWIEAITGTYTRFAFEIIGRCFGNRYGAAELCTVEYSVSTHEFATQAQILALLL